MSVKERVEHLQSLEEQAKATLRDKLEAISANMKAPLAPFIASMAEIGETVISNDFERGSKSWMVFQRYTEAPSNFGTRLTNADQFLDFTTPQWYKIIAQAAGVDIFDEIQTRGGKKMSEAIRLGVNLFWRKNDEVYEMSVYSSFYLNNICRNGPRFRLFDDEKDKQNWQKIKNLYPEEIVVDSGGGFSRYFQITDRLISGTNLDKMEISSGLTKEAIDEVVAKVYFRSSRPHPKYEWRLAWDDETKSASYGLSAMAAFGIVKSPKSEDESSPKVIAVPVPATPTLDRPGANLGALKDISRGIDLLLKEHHLSSRGFDDYGP